MNYDIIGDIHGHAEVTGRFRDLGYGLKGSVWGHRTGTRRQSFWATLSIAARQVEAVDIVRRIRRKWLAGGVFAGIRQPPESPRYRRRVANGVAGLGAIMSTIN